MSDIAWDKVSRISKIKMNKFVGDTRVNLADFKMGNWDNYKVIAFGESVDATNDMFEYRCVATKLDDFSFATSSVSTICKEINFEKKILGTNSSFYSSNCSTRDALCMVTVNLYIKFTVVKNRPMYIDYDILVNDGVHSRIRVFFSDGMSDAKDNGCVGDNIFFGAITTINSGPGGATLGCYFSSSTKIEILGDTQGIKISATNPIVQGETITINELVPEGYARGFFQDITNKEYSSRGNSYLVSSEI